MSQFERVTTLLVADPANARACDDAERFRGKRRRCIKYKASNRSAFSAGEQASRTSKPLPWEIRTGCARYCANIPTWFVPVAPTGLRRSPGQLFLSASGRSRTAEMEPIPTRSQPTEASSPLSTARRIGHAELVKMLLREGADPDARQEGGFTALHSAAQRNNAEMIQALLDFGADISSAPTMARLRPIWPAQRSRRC